MRHFFSVPWSQDNEEEEEEKKNTSQATLNGERRNIFYDFLFQLVRKSFWRNFESAHNRLKAKKAYCCIYYSFQYVALYWPLSAKDFRVL